MVSIQTDFPDQQFTTEEQKEIILKNLIGLTLWHGDYEGEITSAHIVGATE